MFLVDEFKHCWKMLSIWTFALIGVAPDLYQAVVAMGWLQDENVPQSFVWTLRGLAVAGIVGRLIKQRATTKPLPAPQEPKA